MLRRTLLQLAAAPAAALAQKADRPADTFAAGATEDKTPRVGIVLSSFKGSEDHDGTKLRGLADPAPASAALSGPRLDAMVRRAIELGNTRRGGLSAIVEPQDWVVIKPQMTVRLDGNGRPVPGSAADPRVVGSLIAWLVEKRRGARITIADAPAVFPERPFDPWEFSYRTMVNEFARKAPGVRFEILDLHRDETMPMQAPGRESVVYQLASAVVRCDRFITVAPLCTHARCGVLLTLGSYLGCLPEARYGLRKEVSPELLTDLFALRPADYSIVGGEWGMEGDGPFGAAVAPVRHNVIVAGAGALAVDCVAAAIMGLDPPRVAHLAMAARRGFGTTDIDTVWTRGNNIEEARRRFRPGV